MRILDFAAIFILGTTMAMHPLLLAFGLPSGNTVFNPGAHSFPVDETPSSGQHPLTDYSRSAARSTFSI